MRSEHAFITTRQDKRSSDYRIQERLSGYSNQWMTISTQCGFLIGRLMSTYGWPTKTKARLVARGDEKRANIDFGELFAPTVAVSSVRLLTAMACELDPDLCRFDVEQAFVQSDIEENVFMRLPRGFGRLAGKIVRHNNSLYGLN